jgi:hypothetical protein
MTQQEAIAQIQTACREIALQMMKIHPAIPHLEDPQTKADCIQAAHQLTTELEVIKKKLIKLQQRDDSAEL